MLEGAGQPLVKPGGFALHGDLEDRFHQQLRPGGNAGVTLIMEALAGGDQVAGVLPSASHPHDMVGADMTPAPMETVAGQDAGLGPHEVVVWTVDRGPPARLLNLAVWSALQRLPP